MSGTAAAGCPAPPDRVHSSPIGGLRAGPRTAPELRPFCQGFDPPMNLLDILTPDCIKAPLASDEKKGVIDELVSLLAEAKKVGDAGALREAVWTREQTRTTGIGHGPRLRMSSFSVRPSTHSMTMKYEPFVSPRSKMETMFGCERPAA